MKNEVCKYWGEYDDDNGLFEWCKLFKQSVACCGTRCQCHWGDKDIERREQRKDV